MNAGPVRRVVVITGPIASGKSTMARELARELERMGIRTAVIDLDLVYDMVSDGRSKSDEATWALARHGAAALTNTFLDQRVAVVAPARRADGSAPSPRPARRGPPSAARGREEVQRRLAIDEGAVQEPHAHIMAAARSPRWSPAEHGLVLRRGRPAAPVGALVVDLDQDPVLLVPAHPRVGQGEGPASASSRAARP